MSNWYQWYEKDLQLQSEEPGFPGEIYRRHKTSGTRLNRIDDEIANHFEDTLLIDTIHDGYIIPEELENGYKTDQNLQDEITASIIPERDWGASLVAQAVAETLGISGFHEVLLARNVLDFGRFPGISRPRSQHLDRLSVSGPLSAYIRDHCPDEILSYFEKISDQMEKQVNKRLDATGQVGERRIRNSRFIRLAIHTFDPYGGDGVRRPMVGIIHRSRSIAKHDALPDGVFSRLYPDELAAFSADRLLKSSLSCCFEKYYIPEVSDKPYMLPEGSVEMRIQVWLWFQYLRACFEEQARDDYENLLGDTDVIKGDYDGYKKYWTTVMNPTAIRPTTRVIAAFLEGKLNESGNLGVDLQSARKIHRAVSDFFKRSKKHKSGLPTILGKYQYDAYRPSCIAIEIRKDAICHGRTKWVDGKCLFKYRKPKEENIKMLAQCIAEGLLLYRQLQDEKKEYDVPW